MLHLGNTYYVPHLSQKLAEANQPDRGYFGRLARTARRGLLNRGLVFGLHIVIPGTVLLVAGRGGFTIYIPWAIDEVLDRVAHSFLHG